jgi:hypothetical protein
VSIDEFLAQFVDGYLLSDLQAMADVKPDSPLGGVGYPMVVTTLSGIELLGNLLLPVSTEAAGNPSHRGNQCFLYYWDEYLTAERPIYQGLGRAFRQLVRNGVAHTFVAKGNIYVPRNGPYDLRVNRTTNCLAIDCIRFFRDFETSYQNRVRPIVDGTAQGALTTKEDMQARLRELESRDLEESRRVFKDLPSLHPSAEQWPASGPAGGTGGTGPTGYVWYSSGPAGGPGPTGPTGSVARLTCEPSS